MNEREAVRAVKGSFNKAEPKTNCVRSLCVDNRVTGLKISEALRRMYTLFQRVIVRALKECFCCDFSFVSV